MDQPGVEAKTLHRLLGYKGQGGGKEEEGRAAASTEPLGSSSSSVNTPMEDATSYEELSQDLSSLVRFRIQGSYTALPCEPECGRPP